MFIIDIIVEHAYNYVLTVHRNCMYIIDINIVERAYNNVLIVHRNVCILLILL